MEEMFLELGSLDGNCTQIVWFARCPRVRIQSLGPIEGQPKGWPFLFLTRKETLTGKAASADIDTD